MSLNALWFSLALTAVTALVFGLVPALQATKQDLQAFTKQNGADSAGPTRGWLRGLLIGIQVAVCMALLVSAGLLLRALHAAETTDPGFDYRNVAVVSTSFRGPGYDDARVALLRRQLREQIGSQAGIEATSLVGKTPLSPGHMQTTFRRAGEEAAHDVDINPVSPEYFSLIRIPIVQGRTFTSAELEETPRAVIVTEATARRYWPGLDPIGRSIVFGSNTDSPLQIVGIAKDAQVSNVAKTESSYIYLPAGSPAERGHDDARAKPGRLRHVGDWHSRGDTSARSDARRESHASSREPGLLAGGVASDREPVRVARPPGSTPGVRRGLRRRFLRGGAAPS